MKTTNFDRYLDEQMQDPAFAARFEQAGDAWVMAIPIGVRGIETCPHQSSDSKTKPKRKSATCQN